MSQPDPPASPNQEPRSTTPPGGSAPADETAVIAGQAADAANGLTCPNPACRQPVDPDERFCKACGSVIETERSRAWLWVVSLACFVVAAVAYALLYSSAFKVGGP